MRGVSFNHLLEFITAFSTASRLLEYPPLSLFCHQVLVKFPPLWGTNYYSDLLNIIIS